MRRASVYACMPKELGELWARFKRPVVVALYAVFVLCVVGIALLWRQPIVCIFSDTEPATLPIIVITAGAFLVGLGNAIWAHFRPLPPVSDKSPRQERERRRNDVLETKRSVAFDAVLAGVALALYLIVIMVKESLGTLSLKVVLILSLLPGAIGFCHHIFAVGRHFTRRQTTIDGTSRSARGMTVRGAATAARHRRSTSSRTTIRRTTRLRCRRRFSPRSWSRQCSLCPHR